MPTRKKPAPKPRKKAPLPLSAAESKALLAFKIGVRQTFRRVAPDPSWLLLDTTRRLDAVMNEIEELQADIESHMIAVETIDRLAVKLLVLRAGVAHRRQFSSSGMPVATKAT